MSDLSDTVNELEARIAFIEDEVESSLAEENFQSTINQLFPDDADIETRESERGHFHATVYNIEAEDVNRAIENVNGMDDYESSVIETGRGLGMEVWTTNRKV